MSIRARIVLTHLLIVGIGFFYLVKKITDAQEIKPRYMQSVEEPMVDTARLLAALLERNVTDGRIDLSGFREAFDKVRSRPFSARIYSREKTTVDVNVYVTDANGVVIFDSDSGRAEGKDYSRENDVYLTLRGKYGARSTKSDPHDPTSSVLFVAAPIMSGDAMAGVVSVSKPQKSMAAFMQETRRNIFIMGAIAAAAVVLVGTALSMWITRPIQRLTAYARAVRDGRRVPLPKLGSSEIGSLGRAFEDMRDALDGRKYIENYVQTLTHEIKSPVAAIRGAAELLHEEMPAEQRDKFLGNIESETARIQEIVDRLLLLSAVEAKRALDEQKPLDLRGPVQRAGASIAAQAAAKDLSVETTLPTEPCIVSADEFLIEKAILNLLQNAIAFAPRGGIVSASLQQQNGSCELRVEDNGPGIPDYAQPRVFERFFSLPRPDTGKKSSGLGLAFVREVASLHRGFVELKNRPDGGAVAALQLPISSAHSSG
ncbi:MAG TPA: two-component system sensor histidine kinase CreC [Chthoniobacterales bacterium]|nr:two-component system sensor histidine kinase CreC [Chthoniobacterales bacterium]